MRNDPQPDHADARAVVARGVARCGACGRVLQHEAQYRCPYVACRAWLRGTSDDHPNDDHARRRRFTQ
jgi:hypothetical protein